MARDTSLTEAQRERLLDMAKTWDTLADDREQALRKRAPAHKKINRPG